MGLQEIGYAFVGVDLIFYFGEAVAFVFIDFVFDYASALLDGVDYLLGFGLGTTRIVASRQQIAAAL